MTIDQSQALIDARRDLILYANALRFHHQQRPATADELVLLEQAEARIRQLTDELVRLELPLEAQA